LPQSGQKSVAGIDQKPAEAVKRGFHLIEKETGHEER
jgi:hypothetical protein